MPVPVRRELKPMSWPRLGDAEVADLHRAVGEPHDVRGLQVPVHDALFVGVREGGGDLVGDVHDVGDRQGLLLVLLQELAEVAALQELHDEVQHAVVLTEVMDDGDPAVLERRRDARLAPEPLAQHAGEGLVVLRPHRLEALDGDPAAERLVARPPHLAHAATPDQIQEPVTALDQPRVRHRPLSPPLLRCALPGPSSMAFLSAEVVRRRTAARPEPGHGPQDVTGRKLPA